MIPFSLQKWYQCFFSSISIILPPPRAPRWIISSKMVTRSIRRPNSLSGYWDGWTRRDRRRHRSTPTSSATGPAMQADAGLSMCLNADQLMDVDVGLAQLGDEKPWPNPPNLAILENLQLLQLLSRPEKSHFRIRSDSALTMYPRPPDTTNKYIVYDPDGAILELEAPPKNGELPEENHPLADFFGPEVTKKMFSKSETRTRLAQFLEHFITDPERKQYVADLKFLDKCDEHTRIVDALSTGIAEIAATHTSAAATHPLNLPFGLASKVTRETSNTLRVTVHSVRDLFQEARAYAEERLAKYLYPEYVKFQLTQCARSSLSARPSLAGDFRSAYPGLGSAFCLAAPNLPDNPILAASASFTSLHGRPATNRGLLDDLPAGSAATLRLREALALGRETVELVVSFRRDGPGPPIPFWNLFFICPLYEGAAIRYHLGAQINVSASMSPREDDILRVLNFSPAGDMDELLRPDAAPSTEPHPPRRRTFAGLFSRKERSPSPPPLVISAPLSLLPFPTPDPRTATTEELSSAARSTRTMETAGSSNNPNTITGGRTIPPIIGTDYVTQRPVSSTPYASLVVLQLINGGGGGVEMRIVFCSALAQEQIDGGAGVVGKDVFPVLLENRAVDKKAVVELEVRVREGMVAGVPVVGELVLGGQGPAPVKGWAGQRLKRSGAGHTAGGAGLTGMFTSSEASKGGRISGSTERNAISGQQQKMRRLVTHWTPLKDGEGKVEWVVLVLTPAAR
ncbi:hypothetical protein QBC39DRAFT_399227 [Podospora conica]|nr:hypothetical protein QBC39DRAFT_399227 [Schizothecium conicum]